MTAVGRRTVFAPDAPAPRGPYHHGVVAGDLLFCSAMIGMDPSTGAVAGTAGEQTTQALRNLEAICRAAGGRLLAATRTTIYLLDLADLAEVNEAYSTFFGDDAPARSTLQAAKLVGGARVGIDAIVALA